MRKGTPEQFIQELENKIDSLKGVQSSAEVIDDGEEVIEAGLLGDLVNKVTDAMNPGLTNSAEDVEVQETSETVEDAPVEDHESYLQDLYTSVEDKLADLVTGVSWNGDEENIYMDVNFTDGHIFTFTIPREDLVYDLENMDTDVNYICTAVRGMDDAEYEDEGNFPEEGYYDEENPPAYL